MKPNLKKQTENSFIVPINLVSNWDKNPRTISAEDFERLKNQIKKLGVYKPLLCFKEKDKYITLGGNMRLRALKDLKYTEVWISLINPKTEAEKLEYALSDNDRAGEYQKDDLATLVSQFSEDIDMSLYSVDLGKAILIEDLINGIGWNPEKTNEVLLGDGIKELTGYSLSSFWKDISNENVPINEFIEELPIQGIKGNLVRQKYSKTNLEEITRIVKTYMRKGDYFLENCCGWSTFGTTAKFYGYSGIGVDIWDVAIKHSINQIKKIKNNSKLEILNMDGLNLSFNDNKFDYVYCNPPFMDMEKYSGLKNDIADKDFNSFGNKFKKLMSENYRVLKNNCLCTITINDKRDKSFLIPIQKYVIEWGLNSGFKLWDFVVAEVLSQKIRLRKKDYNIKRTVKCHEYVITFKKQV